MMTKKIKYIFSRTLAVIGFVSVLASCSDTLELEPKGTWTPDSFYKNETDVSLAISGIYSSISSGQTFGQNLWLMDSGTDEGYALKGWVEQIPTNLYNHNPSSREVEDLWRVLYSGINNANNFLAKLDPELFEEEDYLSYKGEVLFLRAFFYYQLTIWWNEVPLRLTPTLDQSANHVAPASLETIYLQMIEDFTFAAENLPASNDPDYIAGHANKMAAHAMIAKVYMKAAGYPAQMTVLNGKNPYQAAMEHCAVIKDDGYYQLNPSYKELFLNYIQNRYDYKESLFEVVLKNGSALGVGISGGVGVRNGLLYKPEPRTETPFGDPEISPSPLFNEKYLDLLDPDDPNYDPNAEFDIRKDWNVPSISANAAGKVNSIGDALAWGYAIGKFRRWEPLIADDFTTIPNIKVLEIPEPLHSTQSGVNFPLIRFADVLLLHAEASYRFNGDVVTDEAIDNIDLVRARAGLSSLRTAKPDVVADPALFFNEIVDERFRELCFEGHRKADLIRWNLLPEKIVELDESIRFHPSYVEASHHTKLRCVQNFNEQKHLSMPYPLQEVSINNLLEQKENW